MPEIQTTQPIPLRFPAHRTFAELRQTLIDAAYTEDAICARLQIAQISQFELEPAQRTVRPSVANPGVLDVLIRVLLEGESVRMENPAFPLQVLLDFGVIVPVPDHEGLFAATVMLAPQRSVYVVADRQGPVPENPTAVFQDIVYPSLVPNTDLFLELARPGACDSFLDLCAGTGIAAMLSARGGARHAYAYDITERSTVFADFNRRLNGLENLTAAQGDLYEPAGDLTFDRIVAHPPYVPVFRPQFIFDSGGQDGEQIVRRIVEGLPRYLRPGGISHLLTMGTDRVVHDLAGTDRETPFEHRIREWLGPAEKEFDVAFVVRKVVQPRDWAADSVIRNKGLVTNITEWREFFRKIGAQAMPYGFVTLQRRAKPRPVFTVRRQTGARTGYTEHAWLLQWETKLVENGPALMLSATPRPTPGVRMSVEQHLENAEWSPDAYLLQVDYPFRMELPSQAWISYLLTCADGQLTGAQLLEKLKADGALHPETPADEFAEMLGVLVSGGFLVV